MDTITHGIAGALIGKAMFRGDEMFAFRAMNRGRVITWSLMLGAIFPDSDVFREMFSRNELLILTWHRSITHSLICMPIFALALAALTRWFVRWRKWDAPSFAALTGIYAIGIGSHILLDLVTSFGTMIWSPLEWSRPAWDLIFIVDFTFTGDSSRAADSSLGVREAGRTAEARAGQLAGFRPGDADRGGNRTSGWRADFGSKRFSR